MKTVDLAYALAAAIITLSIVGAAPCRADDATDPNHHYGFLNLLDHRSRYGQYWFPEPFRVDETDVDNELRLDWLHQEGKGRTSDDLKAEIEKSFGLLTLELEAPYARDSLLTTDSITGRNGHDTSEGVGNVSIGARYPVFQYVSKDDFIDDTIVLGIEVGIPTNSPVSRNTELVPKLINDLRLGEHFSVQAVLGYSILFGSRPDGGKQAFEYGLVFGYSFEREELPLPGIVRLIPILELKGDTGLNKGEAGHNNLTGTLGIRLNLKSFGALQPQLREAVFAT